MGGSPRRAERRPRRRRHAHPRRRRRERGGNRRLARGTAHAASLSPDEDELLLALGRARTTLDFAPLNRWGGSVAAAKAERAITERLAAAPAPAGYINSYSVHVAGRLAPDPLAL